MHENLQFILSSVFYVFTRHFWLFCGFLCGGGGALSIRNRLSAHVVDSSLTEAQIKKASFSFFLALFVPSFLTWLLQFSSGQVFPIPETWNSPEREICEILWTLCYLSLFIWIWFLKGTDSILKYMRAMRRSSGESAVSTIIENSLFLKISTLVLFVLQLSDTIRVLRESQMGLL